VRGVAVARVSFDCGADDVEGAQSVVPGGVEVAAHAAPAGQGALAMPVPEDGLVPFRAFDGPLGAVAGPLDGEFAGE
jgi:hypothetical protein